MQAVESNGDGERGRNRTFNLLILNQQPTNQWFQRFPWSVRRHAHQDGSENLDSRVLHNTGDTQWFPMVVPKLLNQNAIHLPDELYWYLFRTYRLTFAMISATAEQFVSHGGNHADRPLITLRLTLRGASSGE